MNKKRLTGIVAGVLAATMVFGTMIFAAGATSPSTHNTMSPTTKTVSTTSTTTAPKPANYIVPKTNGFAAVAGARVTSDYTEVTIPNAIATAVNTNDAYTQALAAALPADATKVIKPIKVRMYVKGVSIWDGFGTFTFSIGVGNQYDGQTVTVYSIDKTGAITTFEAVVEDGKIDIWTTEAATFAVVF